MRRLFGAVVLLILALAVPGVASASGVTSGSTTVGTPVAGTEVDVIVSLTSTTPVVAYEYSIVNRCWFSGVYRGQSESYERFDIAGPWFESNGTATTTVAVNLNDVPAGSACKVSIIDGASPVKDSTTAYSVV
jgi:hypothetical protein